MKKRWLSILLTAALLLTVAAVGSATAFAAGDIGSQISLISSQMSTLKQNDTAKNWYYAVTDLDHNGRLEFIAAAQHPADRSTNMKVWEVSEDGASLAPCRLDILEEETFPDILTDNVDTYHDGQANTWYYLLNDTLVLADNDVYTIKTSITLKDGALSYTPYSYEHTVMNGGVREVSHTDTNGMSISPEQYNAAAVNALAGKERGSISFEWLNAADADNITRLTDFEGTDRDHQDPASGHSGSECGGGASGDACPAGSARAAGPARTAGPAAACSAGTADLPQHHEEPDQ